MAQEQGREEEEEKVAGVQEDISTPLSTISSSAGG